MRGIRGLLLAALCAAFGAATYASAAEPKAPRRPLAVPTGNGSPTKPVPPAAAHVAKQAAKPDFDKVGPQVGDQLPDLDLLTLKGEPQRLGAAWHSGPALLVTSSLTCPKSRSSWPELAGIQNKYGDKLNIVIVYVIEAHPVGSVCPYKGVEDITPENERDGILRKQPTTIEDRVELAQEFKRYLRIDTPIYIDNLKNDAWHAVGAAPNMALLVDKKGIVAARQGWFDGEKLQTSIDALLAAQAKKNAELAAPDELDGQDAMTDLLERSGVEYGEFIDALRDPNNLKLPEILRKNPRLADYVFYNDRGSKGDMTLLMYAIEFGSDRVANYLLAEGADVEARPGGSDSALQIAARAGDVAMTKLLLQHKADPNSPAHGNSPLHEAALHGNRETMLALVAAGATLDIFSEVALGDIKLVSERLLVDPSLAYRSDGEGRMLLDYAAANGKIEIASLLVKTGAPVVVAKLIAADPPLHRAISKKDARMVELLLNAGSSPDTSVGYGGHSSTSLPALHATITANDLAIVKLLLAAKADLGVRNTYSETALHLAAESGNAEIVAALLKAGADVHAKQLGFVLACGSPLDSIPSNNTPLHFAAAKGNADILRLLLEAGAELDAQNADDVTPLMATVRGLKHGGIDETNRLKNVAYLIAAGANVNARHRSGESILDMATLANSSESDGAEQDLPEVIALLKKSGAKPARPAAKEKPVPRSPRSF